VSNSRERLTRNTYFIQNLIQLISQGEGVDVKEGILFAPYQYLLDAEFKKYMSYKRRTIMITLMTWQMQITRQSHSRLKPSIICTPIKQDRPFVSPSEEDML
jgi:hypothetical protein